MNNYLYWFDCDFKLVSDDWLYRVTEAISQRLIRKSLVASSPQSVGVDKWADLFNKHVPGPDSIFLMHTRTGNVEETLEALWGAAGRDIGRLPRCRVVYSNGHHDHYLELKFFTDGVRYCRFKSNDFTWSRLRLEGNESGVVEHCVNLISGFISESQSKEKLAQDLFYSVSERVFEASLIAAAALIRGHATSDDYQALTEYLRIGDLIKQIEDNFPGKSCDDAMYAIEESLAAITESFKDDDGSVNVDAEKLFQHLFRGGKSQRPLYQIIQDFRRSVSDEKRVGH